MCAGGAGLRRGRGAAALDRGVGGGRRVGLGGDGVVERVLIVGRAVAGLVSGSFIPMTSLNCFPGSAYLAQDAWFRARVAPTKNDFKSSADDADRAVVLCFVDGRFIYLTPGKGRPVASDIRPFLTVLMSKPDAAIGST